MAIAIASDSGFTNNNSNSITITKPSGLSVGDLMVAHIGWAGTDAAGDISPPGDWTNDGLDQLWFNSGGNQAARQEVFYKKADSGDVAATNFTFTCGNTRNLGGIILRITGQRPTTEIVVNLAQTTSGGFSAASPQAYAATITPAIANSLIMIFVVSRSSSPGVTAYSIATSDPTFSELYEGSSSGGVITMAYAVRAQATATGDTTIAFSGTNVANLVKIMAISPSFGVTVTPAAVTKAVTIPDETVTGGGTVSVDPVNVTVSAVAPQAIGQADWNAKGKSNTSVFIARPKS